MKASTSAGSGLAVALLPASTVIANPAKTKRMVQIATPIFKNLSIKTKIGSGMICSKSKSSPSSASRFQSESCFCWSASCFFLASAASCSSLVRRPYFSLRMLPVRSSMFPEACSVDIVGIVSKPPSTLLNADVCCCVAARESIPNKSSLSLLLVEGFGFSVSFPKPFPAEVFFFFFAKSADTDGDVALLLFVTKATVSSSCINDAMVSSKRNRIIIFDILKANS
mmetsp:Transcript_21724/g.53884  ORF Transcript_21724/g.53884 Transcript_21724/m.53884 type:complete len:225 (+) Transcript_21724:249-923(+)